MLRTGTRWETQGQPDCSGELVMFGHRVLNWRIISGKSHKKFQYFRCAVPRGTQLSLQDFFVFQQADLQSITIDISQPSRYRGEIYNR